LINGSAHAGIVKASSRAVIVACARDGRRKPKLVMIEYSFIITLYYCCGGNIGRLGDYLLRLCPSIGYILFKVFLKGHPYMPYSTAIVCDFKL
jgi:hypothetical protein